MITLRHLFVTFRCYGMTETESTDGKIAFSNPLIEIVAAGLRSGCKLTQLQQKILDQIAQGTTTCWHQPRVYFHHIFPTWYVCNSCKYFNKLYQLNKSQGNSKSLRNCVVPQTRLNSTNSVKLLSANLFKLVKEAKWYSTCGYQQLSLNKCDQRNMLHCKNQCPMMSHPKNLDNNIM